MPGRPGRGGLAFFTRRYEALELEVSLLERRVASGALSPDDAAGSIKTVRDRRDRRPRRRRPRRAAAPGWTRWRRCSPSSGRPGGPSAPSRTRRRGPPRSSSSLEAEKLAAGNDWRGGVNRFRALLDQWKALPRLDRATDDELWHRFSSARTTYTRRRKAQFAQQNEQRESARAIKEQLAAEAEALADSTDWGPTTGAYRDLMTRWKAAGPAPRGVDEALWKRFRGAQDTFFAAKQAALSEQDAEFRANAEAKEALLAEAEALLPVTDLAAGQGRRTATCSSAGRPSARCRGTRSGRWRTGCARSRPRSTRPRTSAGGGPTPRPGPGPRTPPPSWRPRSPSSEEKAAKAEARGDAKAAPHGRRLGRRPTASGSRRPSKAVDDFGG